MKVLCAGDVHIGRRSSRLRVEADGRTVSTAACWGRIVDLAVSERVDVVALSGDVVDQANRYYEAIGPLEAGIRRLEAEGIVTVAVAGNHDHDVLPRLAESLAPESFRLLGRGGRWERTTIRLGDEVLHVDGWSFPAREYAESPLVTYDLSPADHGFVLGLLHADLDQPRSSYAPVTLAELRARPVHFWLLGHIHAPRAEEAPGQAAVLYPGSPQAMDPGERGEHGVWILDVGPGGAVSRCMVPLSTVQYETVEVDLTGIEEPHRADQLVVDAVKQALAGAMSGSGHLSHLSCRVRVTGRTPLHRELADSLQRLRLDLQLTSGPVTAWVESVQVDARPAVDLEELARGRDAAGVVANLLLALERGELEAVAELLGRARERAAAVRRAKPYLALPGDVNLDDGTVAAALADRAALLLDHLLAQKAE